MNKGVQITCKADIVRHIEQCRIAAETTKTRLLEIATTKAPLALLYQMKFCQVGCDPLDHRRPLNLIEQLNQIFTYVASFKAAEYLLDRHPDVRSLTLNLGTRSGWDIETQDDGGIAAEVFAAVSPQNNDKLRLDIAKVTTAVARYRYVFFMCPDMPPGLEHNSLQSGSVQIVSLGCDWL
ncbi:MAG: hypothetical protein ACLP5H_33430 [Desulfomonilaceae bacterium]